MTRLFDNSMVRRQDRLLDSATAQQIIESAEYGTLSMVEQRDGELAGYGIPINYVWDGDSSIYIHCAPEGHKMECLTNNSKSVALSIVGCSGVVSNKFTTNYQSVLVRGTLRVVGGEDERLFALDIFLKKYSPEDVELGMKYAQKSLHRTVIFRLDIQSVSAKSKRVL